MIFLIYFFSFFVMLPQDSIDITTKPRVKTQFGKGIQYQNEDNSFSFKFNARFQQLYTANYNGVSERWSSQFLIRRARLKFDGYVLNPNLQYKIELGLSNDDINIVREDGNTGGASRIILDAALIWKFVDSEYSEWTLVMGQAKLPSNRERVVSSAKLQFVDRSRLNSRFNIDRDMGIQLKAKYKTGKAIIAPTFAISQGEGRSISTINRGGLSYSIRTDFLPFGAFSSKKGDYSLVDLDREQTPKMSIGLAYNINDRAVRQGGQLGSFVKTPSGQYAENTLNILFADILLKYRGYSILAEYARRTIPNNPDNATTAQYLTGSGLSVQGGYLLASNWEPALRYTSIRRGDFASAISDENQLTLGLSKYIAGHNLKVQSDVTRISFPASTVEPNLQMRMSIEMQF